MKQMFIIGFLAIIIAISGCTTQKQQLVGNDKDIHGCIGSAGYSWCEAKQKCIRVWEENCTETAQTQPSTNPSNVPSTNLGIKKDISISGFAFKPDILTIPKGTTVIWTNMDPVSHTIISDSGTEIVSDSVPQGATYTHTFNTPGTYEYHCSIHPSMKGKIIVE